MGYEVYRMVGKSIKTSDNKIGIITAAQKVEIDDADVETHYSHVIKVMFPGDSKATIYVVNTDPAINGYEILEG